MAQQKSKPFDDLEIVAIIDSTTVAIAGSGSHNLKENDELYILAVGRSIVPKVDLPLVAPKGKVIVTFPAGYYVLARTPVEEKYAAGFAITAADIFSPRVVERRAHLNVNENEMLGNPGRHGVRVGDPVVKVDELVNYIQWYGKESAAAETSKKQDLPSEESGNPKP